MSFKHDRCPELDDVFLKKAIQVIEDNISDLEFDIVLFASHMCLSQSSLYRKIKAITDLSPLEFVRNIQLKHACKLLRSMSVSISEVAYSVGFSDPKYFTSCFKAEFNMTPSEYMKKNS